MPRLRLAVARSFTLPFCAGFVLGAAFMASPAMGLVLATGAAIYIAVHLR